MLQEKAANLEMNIHEMQIMPDHVHLFVKAPPTLPPHYIVGQLKVGDLGAVFVGPGDAS